jgi:hypothetical protein
MDNEYRIAVEVINIWETLCKEGIDDVGERSMYNQYLRALKVIREYKINELLND